jgi:hypothetical protein
LKEIFILDENVFIQSHTCRDIKDKQDDFDSLGLIIQILSRCHKIGLSLDLESKYQEKQKNLEIRKGINGASVRIWRSFFQRQDKQCLSTSQINDLPQNVLHDRHVVEPALFLSGILVTTDEKLKERLEKWAEENHHQLRVMTPNDAISHLDHIANP